MIVQIDSKEKKIQITEVKTKTEMLVTHLQVHLNKLECRGKLIYFSNSTQIVKLVY